MNKKQSVNRILIVICLMFSLTACESVNSALSSMNEAIGSIGGSGGTKSSGKTNISGVPLPSGTPSAYEKAAYRLADGLP